MRIGIDARTLSYPYTGIPIYVHDMIKYWNEYAGDEHEFFLYSNRKFTLDFELKKNWHIVVDQKRYGGIWIQLGLPRLLKNDKIEVFWEPMHFLPEKIKGVRYVVTIHDLAVFRFPELGTFSNALLHKILLKKSCKCADKIVAISQSTKNDVIEFANVAPEKIEVIYNGDSPYKDKVNNISEETRIEILDKWKLQEGYLLFVSTIEPRKNVSTIVKAFEECKKKDNFPYKLVLAGKWGWKYKTIQQTIEECSFKDDIILTGYISEEEKECLYRNAVCLVYPSLYEGFGFPVLEALSVGTPVITSNISSLPEVGGKAALYLNSLYDEKELSGLMLQMISLSTEEREVLKRNGLMQTSKFSRKKCAQELFSILVKDE